MEEIVFNYENTCLILINSSIAVDKCNFYLLYLSC